MRGTSASLSPKGDDKEGSKYVRFGRKLSLSGYSNNFIKGLMVK